MNDDMIRGILLEKKRTARKRHNIGMVFALLLYTAGALAMVYSIFTY